MPGPELTTGQMRRCIERWQAGDRAAADELLRLAGARLDVLTRKMLRNYPNVRGWAETADVLQGSLLRLLNTLQKLSPADTRDFFGLAALHIRRELLDLARHFAAKGMAPAASAVDRVAQSGVGTSASQNDFDLWCRFHEAVDRLPVTEREVFSLTFYHGWTQARIAELLGVDERTVRRRWQSACLTLNELVGGELP